MKMLMVIILLTWVTLTDAAAATFQLCNHPAVFHSGFATVVVEVKLPVKTALCCGVACLL